MTSTHVSCSSDDLAYRDAFEAGSVLAAEFHHREHLRLAYVYLCEGSIDSAHRRMRRSIQHFLDRNGVDSAKYHETLTLAWIQAVRHFIELCPQADSFDGFCAHDPRLLVAAIMQTHYSPERLFSPAARIRFLAPDRHAIPTYG